MQNTKSDTDNTLLENALNLINDDKINEIEKSKPRKILKIGFLLIFTLIIITVLTITNLNNGSGTNSNEGIYKISEEGISNNYGEENDAKIVVEDHSNSCTSYKVFPYSDCKNIITTDSKDGISYFEGGLGERYYSTKYRITVLPGYKIEYESGISTHTTNIINKKNDNYVLTISQADRSGFSCLYSDFNKEPDYGSFQKYKDYIEIVDTDGYKYRRSNTVLGENKSSVDHVNNTTNIYTLCGFQNEFNNYTSTTKYGDISYTILNKEGNYDFDETKIDIDIIKEMDEMVSSLQEIR